MEELRRDIAQPRGFTGGIRLHHAPTRARRRLAEKLLFFSIQIVIPPLSPPQPSVSSFHMK